MAPLNSSNNKRRQVSLVYVTFISANNICDSYSCLETEYHLRNTLPIKVCTFYLPNVVLTLLGWELRM